MWQHKGNMTKLLQNINSENKGGHPLKKLIKKYGHIWMLSYAFIYLPWFSRLQENVNKPYHVMHTALDDLIPFNEYFIVPYLMWFLYVAATIAFFFFKNRDD